MVTTEEYSLIKRVSTPKDGPQEIKPYLPHTFYPVADSTEDSVILIWAHPDNVDEVMDRVFFSNLLMYVSDVHEKKVSLSPFQIMLTQHVSATALVGAMDDVGGIRKGGEVDGADAHDGEIHLQGSLGSDYTGEAALNCRSLL